MGLGRIETFFTRVSKSISDNLRDIDSFTFYGCLFIIGFGLISVLTIAIPISLRIHVSAFGFIAKHIVFLGFSIFLMLFFANSKKGEILFYSNILLCFALVMLIAVIPFGINIKGASRWIGFGGISIQPSEILKPFFIIVNAKILGSKGDLDRSRILKSLGLLSVICFFLILQPDFGSLILFAMICVFQLFLAGMRLKYIFSLGGTVIGLMVFAFFAFPHVKSRVMTMVGGQEVGYQLKKSQESIKSGGFFGKGLGNGTIKYHLPDSHTDFIFSTICEEFGYLFAIILICLYFAIATRNMILITQCTRDKVSIYTVYGNMFLFFCQAFINIGVNLKILPNKGMTLPFVSYGGSALISMGIVIGITMCFTKESRYINNQYSKLYSPF
jgi:cell division protein FtsW